jgi:hypothetical protein
MIHVLDRSRPVDVVRSSMGYRVTLEPVARIPNTQSANTRLRKLRRGRCRLPTHRGDFPVSRGGLSLVSTVAWSGWGIVRLG